MPAITKPLMGRGDNTADFKHALGRYIRELRQARGMTQAELARAVGMSYYTAISAIEVGRNTVPPERYYEFAEALKVNPRAFMQNVLALTNPWASAMLFSKNPALETKKRSAGLPERFKV